MANSATRVGRRPSQAFAKLWGCYGMLDGNDGCLALQSFTGEQRCVRRFLDAR